MGLYWECLLEEEPQKMLCHRKYQGGASENNEELSGGVRNVFLWPRTSVNNQKKVIQNIFSVTPL